MVPRRRTHLAEPLGRSSERTTRIASTLGALATAVVLVACGGESGDQPELAGAERSGLDPSMVLDVVCDHWELGHPDHATINMYVWDLLGDGWTDPVTYTSDDIDVVVADACSEHREDPAAFLEAVRRDLALTSEDLVGMVRSACRRYEAGREATSPDGPLHDLDPFVRDLAASRDVGLEELRTAVTQVCGE